MKISSFLSSVLLANPLASALAISKRADNITGPYYLRTKVIEDGDQAKDGLYVYAYHTGAGLNDAVLGAKADARPGYLNNTYQTFDLNGSDLWSFYLPADNNYAGWEFVQINGGLATSELFINETGLQWIAEESFGGWLACDWWHGSPQLFWRVNYGSAQNLDQTVDTCTRVELKVEMESEDE